MTRKHFRKLAELILKNSRLASVRNNPMFVIEQAAFVNDLCKYLISENANFDTDKFKEATGQLVSQKEGSND
tara:strand:- start:743 stop:958 length:216 start_codon:yes stop_codon:yes gene_type:complete